MSRVATHEGEANQMNTTLQTIRKSLVKNSKAVHVSTAELYLHASLLSNRVIKSGTEYFATAGDAYKKVGDGYGIKKAITEWVITQGTVDGVRYITESHCKMARMVIAQGTGSFARDQFVSDWFGIVTYDVTDEEGKVTQIDEIEWKKDGNAYKLIKAIESGNVSFSETNGYRKATKAASQRALTKTKKDRKGSVTLTAYDSSGNPIVVKKTKLVTDGVKANKGKQTQHATNAMRQYRRAIDRAIKEYNRIAKVCDQVELSLSA